MNDQAKQVIVRAIRRKPPSLDDGRRAMESLDVSQIDLTNCISEAQSEPLVLTRAGEPVVLVVGVNGLDHEQVDFGASAEFWKLIQSRRAQTTISRQDLDIRISTD